MATKSKNTKSDTKTAEAVGDDKSLATTGGEANDVLAAFPDPSTLVERITKAALQGVSIERIVTLEAGQMIRGTYLGTGPTVEVTDPVTGEVRNLNTHRVEAKPGVVARLIESHQLGRELEGKNGQRLRIMKLGQVQTRKGRRVNDYIIAVEQ